MGIGVSAASKHWTMPDVRETMTIESARCHDIDCADEGRAACFTMV